MNVLDFLDGVAGATNDTFRLVGSPMQQEAREARAAVAELIATADWIQRARSFSPKQRIRLREALARVNGEAA